MNSTRIKRYAILLLIPLVAACSSSPQQMSTPSQPATEMPVPTHSPTPLPSETAQPTPSSSPTLMPSPTETEPPPTPSEPTRTPLVVPTLGADANSLEDWLVLFNYDHDAPLELEQELIEERDGADIYDVRFASPVRRNVKAYLVMPPGEGPFAGIVYLHWYEPGAATNDRSEFLEEAVEMAQMGAVSVLVQQFFPWVQQPSASDYERDRSLVVQQVVEASRAIDLLNSLPQVDTQRIAVVGHDFGAMYATVLAGIDKRVQATVYLAGIGSFSDWFLRYWPSTSTGRDEYRQAMLAVDPLSYFPQISPAAIFFQFAEHDEFFGEADAQKQFEAAGEPKLIKWYDAEHELNEAAQRDRKNWLQEQLSLSSP